jgi:DNA repair exonuclease SbcCD nuclease subunit
LILKIMIVKIIQLSQIMIKFNNNKIAICADLHIGSHLDNQLWHSISLDFAKWFKQKLIENNIKDIVICGDIFNNREEISVLTIHTAKEFFSILKDFNITLLVGNHDIYFKNRTDINSISILDEWENITVISNPVTYNFQGREMCFAPWGAELDLITKCDILFGHFEIQTFKTTPYHTCQEGVLSEDLFKKSNLIISGHFHVKDERKYENGTILYIGNPYQLNWNDCELTKGFYILDIKSLNYNFIQNNISPIHKKYNLSEFLKNGINDTIKKEFNKNFIKLVIDTDINENKINLLYNKLCNLGPHSLKLEYNNQNEINSENFQEIDYNKENFDLEKTIRDYIYSLDVPNNKNDIINYVLDLYKKVNDNNTKSYE